MITLRSYAMSLAAEQASAVAFIKKAGGIDKANHFSNHHLVLNLVNVRTAELKVDAPAVEGASFNDMIMTAEGLCGFFDRTKTSGAGKNQFSAFLVRTRNRCKVVTTNQADLT